MWALPKDPPVSLIQGYHFSCTKLDRRPKEDFAVGYGGRTDTAPYRIPIGYHSVPDQFSGRAIQSVAMTILGWDRKHWRAIDVEESRDAPKSRLFRSARSFLNSQTREPVSALRAMTADE